MAVAATYKLAFPYKHVHSSQSVEELAMGDEGWCYQGPEVPSKDEGSNKSNAATTVREGGEDAGEGAPIGVAEIRNAIVQLARREDR